MNAKNGIKIVKRAERDAGGKSEAARVPDGESRLSATQKATRQVAAWVKEFQQRRVQEAGQKLPRAFFQRA